MAGAAQALIGFSCTAQSCETWQASAREGTDAILTGASIQARIRCAVIDIHLTIDASVARAAGTSIAAKCVGASAPVSTWVLVTFINVNVALLPLPAWCTTADKLFIIRSVVTDTIVLTWVREARSQDILTVPSGVRQVTPASVTGNAINTGALVEAGAGSTVVYIGLAVSPLEAFFAFATIAIDIICAGAKMLAWIGFTLIAVHITIGTSPAWLTFALVSIDVVMACAMHAGAAAALIHF